MSEAANRAFKFKHLDQVTLNLVRPTLLSGVRRLLAGPNDSLVGAVLFSAELRHGSPVHPDYGFNVFC